MRIPMIALAAVLAAGCTAPGDGAPADGSPVDVNPPAASTPAPAPSPAPLPGSDPAPDPGPPASITIPVRFHGTWAADATACADGGDVTHLVLRASGVEFYESVGDVLAVTATDAGGIDVDLRLSGEGDTWEETYGFRLSDDGQTLTDTGSGLVRARCG